MGSTSGQPLLYETHGYAEATIIERMFSGASYDFCLRLAVLSTHPVYQRIVDERISKAWLEAAVDLGIRVVAPFPLTTDTGESLLYEAHIADFGGPQGIILGLVDRDYIGDMRSRHGYAWSNVSERYRQYDRQLFIDTLNDWQWCGQKGGKPSWHTGKTWS